MPNKDSIQQVLADCDALWGDLFKPPTARTGVMTDVGAKIYQLEGRAPFMVQGDVAKIYGVEPRELNRARQRNPAKFQDGVDFFQLKKSDVTKCHIAYNGGHLPYAYTRRGAYMFATILQTPEATEQAIRIVEGFMAFEHALESKEMKETLCSPLAIDHAQLAELVRQAVAAALPQPVSTEPRKQVLVDAADYELLKLRAEAKPGRRPFTGDEKTTMRVLKAQGWKDGAIGDKLGRSPDSVADFFRRERIKQAKA